MGWLRLARICKISGGCGKLQVSFAKEPYKRDDVGKSLLNIGWLRLVGSLKLQVSFAEYIFFYRALLQKRPVILRSLLIAATRYSEDSSQHRLFYRALLQKRPVILTSLFIAATTYLVYTCTWIHGRTYKNTNTHIHTFENTYVHIHNTNNHM